MSDHGFIALGKYSNAKDSILHYLCQSDWANGSFGDVEAPTGFVYRISLTENDVQVENTEFTSLLSEWFEGNPEVTDSPELRAELVGFWIVNEDSNGFIHVMDAQNEKTQLEIFHMLRDKFEEWDTEESQPTYYREEWESEQDYEPGRPDTYFLTIYNPDGEEYATIIHRTVNGQYPLDGELAKLKEQRADHIVAALNAYNADNL